MTTGAEPGLQALQDAPDYRPADGASDFQALHEIVRAAHARLDRNTWDYLVGGSETETTLCRNRQALDCVAFRPRMLRNVSAIDTSATFFGQKASLPVILAPVGSLASFHPNGGEEAARGAPRLKVFQL